MTKNKSKVLTRFNVSDFKLLLHLLMKLFHIFNLSVVYYQEDRKNTWNQMEIHMFVFTRKKKDNKRRNKRRDRKYMDFSSTLKRFYAALTWPMNRGHLHPVGSESLYKQLFANEDLLYMTLHMEANLSLLLLLLSKVAR